MREEFQQNGLTVQYFERARFEWHPGAWPSRYDVELGLLGDELTAGQTSGAFQRTAAAGGNSTYFAATGHNLCGGFQRVLESVRWISGLRYADQRAVPGEWCNGAVLRAGTLRTASRCLAGPLRRAPWARRRGDPGQNRALGKIEAGGGGPHNSPHPLTPSPDPQAGTPQEKGNNAQCWYSSVTPLSYEWERGDFAVRRCSSLALHPSPALRERGRG